MKEGSVVVLLATRNRAHLIEETLDSILNQTYKNWKCIVIDDFSSDTTSETVRKYVERDARFCYQLKPSDKEIGLSSSRNYGLSLAQLENPEFIQFFDDDDLMHPEKLTLQVQALMKNPSSKFCICGTKGFKKNSELNGDEYQEFSQGRLTLGEAYLTGAINFVAQVPLFRYDYAKNFKFDEDLFYAEEWTLFSMLFLLEEPEYEKINKVLFYRRKHPVSITESKDENFQKRKTSAVTGVKIFNFLTKNKAHTRVTLFYFLRESLLYKYNSEIIKTIGVLIKHGNRGIKSDYWRYSLSIKIHWLARKFILRILKY